VEEERHDTVLAEHSVFENETMRKRELEKWQGCISVS
jgi:hypothetical protein